MMLRQIVLKSNEYYYYTVIEIQLYNRVLGVNTIQIMVQFSATVLLIMHSWMEFSYHTLVYFDNAL